MLTKSEIALHELVDVVRELHQTQVILMQQLAHRRDSTLLEFEANIMHLTQLGEKIERIKV